MDPHAEAPRRRSLVPQSAIGVAAAAALLLALGSTGGAVAGSLITGKQIKNGTVASADIKDKSIRTRDLARSARPRAGLPGAPGSAGPRGPAGPQGPAGTAGERGSRGYSAWDEVPSGETITGYIFQWKTSNQGAAAIQVWLEQFPAKAPRDLTLDEISFAPSSNGTVQGANPDCTGTVDTPTAPVGQVCVYLGPSPVNAEDFEATIAWDGPRDGFIVEWSPVSPDGRAVITGFSATWAYTAP